MGKRQALRGGVLPGGPQYRDWSPPRKDPGLAQILHHPLMGRAINKKSRSPYTRPRHLAR